MKQQCYIWLVYVTWAVYIVGLVILAMTGGYLAAVVWLVGVPLAQWLYIRTFPRISRLVGYGSAEDEKPTSLARAPVRVTLYTAVGCPFCPLVERRLEDLRREIGFDLERIDVTLRPDLLTSKRIRAVPVVELGERRLIGNSTSKQLVELIRTEVVPA